jgi:hypothetical protein
MTLPESDSSTRPAGLSDSKTVPAGSVDGTRVGPALATRLPPAGTPPPPPPPPAGSPLGDPPPERDYTIPIRIGVFIVALVGIGLLGLGVYAVMRLTPNNGVAAGAGTATLLPLSTQVVFIPTTTPMPTPTANATPSQAPTATALPPTATEAATITATVTATSTQAGNMLTVDQGANLRSGPGFIYQVVGGLKAGDTVPVVGRDVSSSWYVISYKGGFGGQGWISSFVTTFNGDKSKLPVVAAPPPPLPTATPKPAGNPNGGLVTGARGVSGMLNLCSSQVTFAVGERVCFVEWIKNNTGQRVGYGILGVTAVRQGGGVQFQTSWSGEQAPHGLLGIDPGCIGPTDHCKGQWEDGMRLNNPGTYQLTLNVCFSDYPTCRGTTGDWEVLSGAIVITVQ